MCVCVRAHVRTHLHTCYYKQHCSEHPYICLLAHMGQWNCYPFMDCYHLLREQSWMTQEASLPLALLLERDLVVSDVYLKVKEFI